MKAQRRPRPRVRNQRIANSRQRKQQHLLDVRVRSRSAAQQRNRRFLVFVSKIVLAAAVIAGAFIGGRLALRHFFFENADYRLANIEIQTDGTLQREQVLAAAELREGENIFRVNLSQVHERLQALAQVDEVQVVRKMPAEIDIRIVERKPIAWMTSEKQVTDPFQSDAAFLVDGRGILMKEKKLLPEYLGLPLITGCASESFEPGKAVESLEAKAALELLRASGSSFMQTRFQIREIDASKGYCLVVTDKNHTRVTLGFDHFDEQIRRLEQFLVYADDTNRDLETVNLIVQRNVPVTFMQPVNEIINDTLDPDETPRIMKAIPVHPPGASGKQTAEKNSKSAITPSEKTQIGPQPFSSHKRANKREEPAKDGE